MKTLIHVWTHNFNINQDHLKKYNHLGETNFYFGIGDLIRSTIKLYYLARKMNFNLYVDLQLHPIHQFLELPFSPFSSLVLENKDNIDYVCYGAVEDYINNTPNNKIMYILTNDFYDGQIDEDCRLFIKSLLVPTPPMQEYIDFVINSLPFNNYNILHIRLGDNYFHQTAENTDFLSISKVLNHRDTSNDLLITDTPSLKKHLFINSNIFSLNTFICHLGLEKDPNKIRDTLLDLFLMMKCKKIKTYCRIHQVSGFVKWIAEIYNIPLEIL